MGYILLEGGAEFGGRMEAPDRRALMLAGGPNARVSIIPAAAAPDHNHVRVGENGVRWFQGLGATHIAALPLIDRATADDPSVVKALRQSRFIYLLGGFPRHLCESLMGSHGWQAMLYAYHAGAVLAGSSAGAMVLCEHYYDPTADQALGGLGLLPGICVLPHHDTFGQRWAPRLSESLKGVVLVGIDEETGMLNDGPQDKWQPYGKGTITLYRDVGKSVYGPNMPFDLAP